MIVPLSIMLNAAHVDAGQLTVEWALLAAVEDLWIYEQI